MGYRTVFYFVSTVLRIWDVNAGSEFFPIPDLGSKDPGSDPHQRISIFLTNIIVLSSRKYDPGCSSWIRILIFFTYPGSRGQKGTRSGSTTLVSKLYSTHGTVVVPVSHTSVSNTNPPGSALNVLVSVVQIQLQYTHI